MEAVVRTTDNKIVHINGCGHGGTESLRYAHYPIPDQPIPAEWWDGNRFVANLTWPDDLVRDTVLEYEAIDQKTGKAINKGMHPLAGVEEQIGTMRVQIGEILNHLGLSPTTDFDNLNTIATQAIQDAAAKKAAL